MPTSSASLQRDFLFHSSFSNTTYKPVRFPSISFRSLPTAPTHQNSTLSNSSDHSSHSPSVQCSGAPLVSHTHRASPTISTKLAAVQFRFHLPISPGLGFDIQVIYIDVIIKNSSSTLILSTNSFIRLLLLSPYLYAFDSTNPTID